MPKTGCRFWLPVSQAKSRGLLADRSWSSLPVQFGEKRFFLERVAGAQQFQQWILGVRFRGALGVQVDGVCDQRSRRRFELRISAGLACQERNKLTYALALLFGAGREFNPHAMLRMHNP